MTVATAVVAATPRLHSVFEHGKLRGGAAASRSTAWGLLQVAVPKRWFYHFYLLGVATSAVVLADVLLFEGSLFTASIQGKSVCSRIAGRSERALELGAESLLCLLLLTLQMARRLWECVAVTKWGSSRMSLAGYVVGIVHYQLMVLTIIAEAPPVARLSQQAKLGWASASNLGLGLAESIKFRHAAAVGLFVVGFVRQHEAIVHLASLRGPRAAGAGGGQAVAATNAYAIPTDGWFQHVSCAHYSAELLVYAAFVVLGSFKGRGLGQGYLVAFAWVFANQALVAGRAHAWYLQKFEGYPSERKRLIPGVW
eukprot:g7808.t1